MDAASRQSGPESPPSDTWVLRGGTLQPRSSFKNYDDVYAAYQVHGLCVAIVPGLDADAIAQIGKFGSEFYIHATADELRTNGFDVVLEPRRDWPNGLLVLPSKLTIPMLDGLRTLMMTRGTRPNPSPARRESKS